MVGLILYWSCLNCTLLLENALQDRFHAIPLFFPVETMSCGSRKVGLGGLLWVCWWDYCFCGCGKGRRVCGKGFV